MAKGKTSAAAAETSLDEGRTSPPLRIASARDGRRRAGMEHPRQARLHPAGAFTLEQVELLELDPVLTVTRLTDELYAVEVEKAAAKARADQA